MMSNTWVNEHYVSDIKKLVLHVALNNKWFLIDGVSNVSLKY